MNRIINALFAVVALAVALAGTVFLATIGLAVLGGVALAGVAGTIVLALTGRRRAPAPAHAAGARPFTVRRDARGTIIDM